MLDGPPVYFIVTTATGNRTLHGHRCVKWQSASSRLEQILFQFFASWKWCMECIMHDYELMRTRFEHAWIMLMPTAIWLRTTEVTVKRFCTRCTSRKCAMAGPFYFKRNQAMAQGLEFQFKKCKFERVNSKSSVFLNFTF